MTDVAAQHPEPFDEQLAAVKRAQAFSAAVEEEVRRLRVRDRARETYDLERAASIQTPGFDAGVLADVLARPRPPQARVEGLIPWSASTLVVAQRKTGKTTFMLNLTRTLLSGGDFLGRFPVRPLDGKVGFLNFEVSAHQLADWANEHGVPHDRLYMVNLRGRRNPFAHPDDRTQLVGHLRDHDVETLVVDPFGRAYTGKSQNDPGEVGSWLADLDRFAREDGAGALDVVLAAHAGWDGERTRGSTALEDWADSIITIVRDKTDDQQRYLRAEGRDVHIDEDQLLHDPRTRTLTLAGAGSRRTTATVRKLEQQLPHVLDALQQTPGMSGNALDAILKDIDVPHQKGDGAKAAQLGERRGLIRAEKNGRGWAFHPLTSPTSPEPPPGDPDDFPHLPLLGGGHPGDVHHQENQDNHGGTR